MWCAGAGGGQRTVRRSSSPLPAGQPPTNSLFSAFGSMPATIPAAWQREPGRQRARSADVCVRVWSAADGSREQAAAWSRPSQSRRRHLRALSAHSQPTPRSAGTAATQARRPEVQRVCATLPAGRCSGRQLGAANRHRRGAFVLPSRTSVARAQPAGRGGAPGGRPLAPQLGFGVLMT